MKIICNRVDIIHRNSFQNFENENWVVSTSDLITVNAHNGIQYEEETEDSEHGFLLNKTVTVRTNPYIYEHLRNSPLKYYLLKLYREDNSFFFVGDKNYPCTKEISTDKTEQSLVFITKKPL
ncbi:MAG: hypothetical protein LBS50_10230 [Prevotellaceae bacterium]|jgi:hypothetical protein|nr:hypothetical protein [Prevotellaceae bacterium]